MRRTSQPEPSLAKQAVERVAVSYSYIAGQDSKGKPIWRGVAYTRVGSISEAEAIKRGYESDEYMDRRERVRRSKLAA